MKDVHHTLTVIGEIVSLPQLALNENGQAEIVFGDDLSTYITKLSDTEMELSFRLPDLNSPDAGMVQAMLQANSLGVGTGSGRLAIDPVNQEALYCDRWDVEDLTAPSVEKRFRSFLEHAAFWLTDGADAILEEGTRLKAAAKPSAMPLPIGREQDDVADQPFFVRA